MSTTVSVPKDLEDLIPGFLKNRYSELDALRTLLDAGDFAQIRMIGHRMKGVGNSFGFADVTRIGAGIEEGALASQHDRVSALIGELDRYLQSITIIYV